MTDSTDNNQPNNEHLPPNEQSDDVGKASNDLSNAAQEAMRLLKQSQNETLQNKADASIADDDLDENGNTTNDLQQDAYKAMKADAEQQRDAEVTARETDKASGVFTDTMRIKFESSEGDDAIVTPVLEELIVGRADNVTDYVPDIDLTPHGAYRLGLSRRHAIILRDGNRILVKDLNSRNGTFVNGAIVPSGGTQVVRNGDEVRFGNLVMRVTFEGE